MKQIKRDISFMKDKEVISILLFCLYKLSNDPEYSAISELAYVLDKESLCKLCSTFGGSTIKIPTEDELEVLVKTLLVFQYVEEKEISFEDACELAEIGSESISDVVKLYNLLSEALEDYDN